jgi:predicted heme/steroid binding protein
MPAELRSRKVAAAAPSPVQQQEREIEKPKTLKKKKPADDGPVDLEPNIFVMLGMIAAFFGALFVLIYYKIDNRDHGNFALWVNKQFPLIERTLNRPPSKANTPLFGADAQSTGTGGLQLTEEELKKYTGEDGQPIYLAIDGKIFDVSASPAFYGPGGHYHHFVGKDATRAWVTECWDEPEQFTWRMDDVEVMFAPKWMDEQLEEVASGKFSDDIGDVGAMPQDMMAKMAKTALGRFGTVDEAEKKKRRKEDKKEANAKVAETLNHWVKFFSDNKKYKLVGSVIRDETRPDPPKPCEAAMKKRPMKGGKLEAITGKLGNVGQGMWGAAGGDAAAGGAAAPAAEKPKGGEMPEHIKQMLADKAKNAKKGAESAADKVEDTAEEAAEATEAAKEYVKLKAEQAKEEAVKEADRVRASFKDAIDAMAGKAKQAQEKVADVVEDVVSGGESDEEADEELFSDDGVPLEDDEDDEEGWIHEEL